MKRTVSSGVDVKGVLRYFSGHLGAAEQTVSIVNISLLRKIVRNHLVHLELCFWLSDEGKSIGLQRDGKYVDNFWLILHNFNIKIALFSIELLIFGRKYTYKCNTYGKCWLKHSLHAHICKLALNPKDNWTLVQ